jgi:hypothetical protein
MKHWREKLRDELVREVVAAQIPGVLDNVKGSRFAPARPLPVAYVFPSDERIKRVRESYEREVAMVVLVIMAADEGVEDLIDSACASIETAVDPSLAGLVQNGYLAAVQFERSTEGNEELMHVQMTYVFTYVTALRDPTQATN